MKTTKLITPIFLIFILLFVGQYDTFVSAKTEYEDNQRVSITYYELSSGYRHTCAMNSNDELKCWGSNTYGQIGDHTYQFIARSSPGSVPGLANEAIRSFTAGGYNTCIITQTGGLKCWGDNNWKQLGNPDYFSWASGTPIPVKGMNENVDQVGIGNGFICALKEGDVFCWGFDYTVPNPDPETWEWITIEEPQLIESDYSFTSLSVNGGHACGITTDNKLACWGLGGSGQLGYQTNDNEPSPTIVENLLSVSMVGLGDYHSCAVGKLTETDTETLYCWGSNSSGQLGIDPGADPSLPSVVVGITGEVLQIAGGAEHTCVIARENEENQVYCWGSNAEGQLGTGSTQNAAEPTPVSGSQGAIQIAAGASHTTILKDTGFIQSWGTNKEGQLGNGALFRRQLPIHLQNTFPSLNDEPLKDVISGELHTCALTDSGSVFCWGGNQYGQVGNGSIEFAKEPVRVLDSGVAKISAGPLNTCAVLDTGEVMCWGWATSRFTEDGYQNNGLVPGYVLVEENEERINNIVSVEEGNGHLCALNSAGKIFCWGNNYFGQLGIPIGDDPFSSHPFPQVVEFFIDKTVVSLSVGMEHTCAVIDLGDVYCWGVNYNGELGIGTTDFDPHPEPTPVIGLSGNVVDISAGMGRTCVLSNFGEVSCWGRGSIGHTPKVIAQLPGGVSEISTGGSFEYIEFHTCAVLQDTGAVKCWGYNNYSQLGDGTYRFFGDDIPVDVLGLAGNVKSVSAGAASTCALFDSGAATCWGFDYQIETLPVDLIEVNDLDLPPSIFFSNYYDGAPDSYFVITGLYFPPNQSVNIYINDLYRGSILANETGVFKFFTYFDEVGAYTVRVEPSLTQASTTMMALMNRAVDQYEIDLTITDSGMKRIKEGDGFTIGTVVGDDVLIFLPLILR